MPAERWRQIETLFALAVECPAQDLPLFLDKVCRGDEDLRRELESLLACDAPEQQLIDVPPPPESDAGMAGQRIGPYRLIRLIGQGGMGGLPRHPGR